MSLKRGLFWGLVACAAMAAADTPEERRARAERIANAVLAPCCYTEPVARHQSAVAVKMRLEIAAWIEQGKSDEEILSAYTAQYGPKILMNPDAAPRWWAAWVPWGALLIGAGALALFLWRHARAASPGTG